MSKRVAGVQLTADNAEDFDQEQEEAGRFQVANEEELKKRVIKTARRGRNMDTSDSGSTGIFANLKSLSGSSLGKTAPSLSSLFSSSSAAPPSSSAASPSSSARGAYTFSATVSTSAVGTGSSYSSSSLATACDGKNGVSNGNSAFMDEVRKLNMSVSSWISKHVLENPYVDLTPVFNDYKAHLQSIDSKYSAIKLGTLPENAVAGQQKAPALFSGVSKSFPLATAWDPSSGSQGTFMTASAQTSGQDISKEEGEKESEDAKKTQSDQEVPGHSDSTGSPSQDQATESSLKAVDDDEDALFSGRAKLYYKKEEEFVDLGVGVLKVQSPQENVARLLLRNDSSLHTVLLNVNVTQQMPVNLTKTNILIRCPAANPPLSIGEGPVTYLIRVKTSESAQQLYKVINTQTGKNT